MVELVWHTSLTLECVWPTIFIYVAYQVQAVPGLRWARFTTLFKYTHKKLFPGLQRTFQVYNADDSDATEEIRLQKGQNGKNLEFFYEKLNNSAVCHLKTPKWFSLSVYLSPPSWRSSEYRITCFLLFCFAWRPGIFSFKSMGKVALEIQGVSTCHSR